LKLYILDTAGGIDRNELKPGDLIFFQNTYRPGVSHVGIYMGNGTFVHNQSTEKDVQISKLTESYWNGHYLTARRVAKSQ
jgi:murein DD-endopeptidase